MCAGAALRYWAILTLGRFFRFEVLVQDEHKVVTGGPYRFVRHPFYTGILLIQLGLGIALGNFLSVLICLSVPILGFLPRIQHEELRSRMVSEPISNLRRRYEATDSGTLVR